MEEFKVTCEQCGCMANNYLIVNSLCYSCRSDNESEFYEHYDEDRDIIF